jgi:hypothetical protein
MKNDIHSCRFCGKKIGIITWGVYRKVVVDAEAVMIEPDPEGEIFIRIDGSKVKGREVGYEEAVTAEQAYRPHRKTCGVNDG